jgi:outer membrane biosynthesis protein TonB
MIAANSKNKKSGPPTEPAPEISSAQQPGDNETDTDTEYSEEEAPPKKVRKTRSAETREKVNEYRRKAASSEEKGGSFIVRGHVDTLDGGFLNLVPRSRRGL